MADEKPHEEDTGADPEVPLDILELYEVIEWEKAVEQGPQ